MKFVELKPGDTFWLRGVACRKVSPLSYIQLGNAAMGEMYIDPADDAHLTITKDEALADVQALAKKPAVNDRPLPVRGVQVHEVLTGEDITGV